MNRIHTQCLIHDSFNENDEEVSQRDDIRENDWHSYTGAFEFISVLNHSLPSFEEDAAPISTINDGCMDILFVHSSGRLKMAKFFIKMWRKGKHI